MPNFYKNQHIINESKLLQKIKSYIHIHKLDKIKATDEDLVNSSINLLFQKIFHSIDQHHKTNEPQEKLATEILTNFSKTIDNIIKTEEKSLNESLDLFEKLIDELSASQSDNNSVIPEVEYEQAFLLTPEELLNNLEKLLPNERLVRINFSSYPILAFRIEEKFFIFDPNINQMDEFFPYHCEPSNIITCHSPEDFLLKLAASQLKATLAKENKSVVVNITEDDIEEIKEAHAKCIGEEAKDMDIDKSRYWLLEHPAALPLQFNILTEKLRKIYQIQNSTTESEENKEQKIQTLNLNSSLILPPILGFTWQVYKHPQSATVEYSDDIVTFEKLIERVDAHEETILMKMITIGQQEKISALLQQLPANQKKSFINKANKDGVTALRYAHLHNFTEIEKDLEKTGADPEYKEKVFLTLKGLDEYLFDANTRKTDRLKVSCATDMYSSKSLVSGYLQFGKKRKLEDLKPSKNEEPSFTKAKYS